MDENLDKNNIIEDIDLPLYKYGLIHKQDVNNYFDSEKKKKVQKFKSISMICLALMNVIRFILCAKFFNNEFPLFYYDLIKYYGGLNQYFYAIVIIASIEDLILNFYY
jgi:hypothetical protein